METMAAQVSIYPLRQASISDAISGAIAAFRATGVEVQSGAMSTVVAGTEDAVFAALREGYRAARMQGDVVMVATLSNSCPAQVELGQAGSAKPFSSFSVGARPTDGVDTCTDWNLQPGD